MNDEVGTQFAILAFDRLLFTKIAVIEHAGEFDHAPQLDLAPTAAHGRLSQRTDEVAGLAAQRNLLAHQLLHLFGHRLVGHGAVFFEISDLDVKFIQGLADRLQGIVDTALPRLEIGSCLRLEGLELRARQIEELLVVAT